MQSNQTTLLELLRTATASMNQKEIGRFSTELKIRLPEVINQAAQAATTSKGKETK